MSHEDEIHTAFRQAIRQDENGRLTISTHDFVAELARRNWPHTLRAANHWIEIHITPFQDVSVAPGDDRLFRLS
ncbi:DNA polymerase V subunit [Pantoea sp. USHLN298]|uniref:DNA polymerase V subunit n=1 Tax=Pantoea sp. USHLN298 TaxID=3081294 RepID=UPI0030178A82